jgi:hypothetical protein
VGKNTLVSSKKTYSGLHLNRPLARVSSGYQTPGTKNVLAYTTPQMIFITAGPRTELTQSVGSSLGVIRQGVVLTDRQSLLDCQ